MAESPLIAIVDDDESVRDALTSLLHAVGWQAEAFASAEAFLQSGQAHTTACLLLDVRLPGLSGLELQRQLRSSQARLPLIFLTAHGTEALRAQTLQAGAVAFFAKPFSDTALLEAIHTALAVDSGSII
jgi:FixJ family two-component response regulator